METNVITIMIGGYTASGKSTIASLIEDKLLEEGFNVEFTKEHPDDDKFIEKKIEALKTKNTKISIVERRINRPV